MRNRDAAIAVALFLLVGAGGPLFIASRTFQNNPMPDDTLTLEPAEAQHAPVTMSSTASQMRFGENANATNAAELSLAALQRKYEATQVSLDMGQNGADGSEYRPISFEDYGAGKIRAALKAQSRPASTELKIQAIWEDLVEYSGVAYPIRLLETGAAGAALPGGQILLDLSIAAAPMSVTQFFMAHEWAHQVKGHVPNTTTPYIITQHAKLLEQIYPTISEDAADVYAGQFMAAHPRRVRQLFEKDSSGTSQWEKLENYLCTLPIETVDAKHRPGEHRARIFANEFNAQLAKNPDSDNDGDDSASDYAITSVCGKAIGIPQSIESELDKRKALELAINEKMARFIAGFPNSRVWLRRASNAYFSPYGIARPSQCDVLVSMHVVWNESYQVNWVLMKDIEIRFGDNVKSIGNVYREVDAYSFRIITNGGSRKYEFYDTRYGQRRLDNSDKWAASRWKNTVEASFASSSQANAHRELAQELESSCTLWRES